MVDNHRGNKRKVQIGAHTTENSRQRSGTHSPFLYMTVRASKSGHRPGQDSALPAGGAVARNHRHSMPKQNSCAQTLERNGSCEQKSLCRLRAGILYPFSSQAW